MEKLFINKKCERCENTFFEYKYSAFTHALIELGYNNICSDCFTDEERKHKNRVETKILLSLEL